jgi:hypothetical protein
VESPCGDRFGLPLPAHARALLDAGPEFLTAGFAACGVNGRVTRIVESRELALGSTGRKLFLTIESGSADIPTELFVKFSRDFDDPIRDRAKDQLDAEVRLALLSRSRQFPVAVPRCLFADYHAASGTGLVITERIAYGRGRIEPHYDKCLDDEMPKPLAHYRALVTALARLVGAHKSGRLGSDVEREFPFDAGQATKTDPIRYDVAQLQRRVAKYGEFAARYPQLLPANIRSPDFIGRLAADIPLFLAQEHVLKGKLHAHRDFIALCHWNANVDNAWFWRDGQGALQCGLMDWGRVGQMNIAQALLGSLIAAELELWDRHLDDLLATFVAEVRAAGGPALDARSLERQLYLFAALMGLAWLMDAPALVQRACPDLAAIEGRRDARFKGNETARVQLHMLTTVLHLWESRRFGALPGEAS